MNGTEPKPTQALVTYTPPQPMAVSDEEVKAYSDRVMAYAAKSGDGALFAKDLTPVQAAQLARVALAYKLDPFMGELTVYKSKPYVTIDGRTRMALNHPAYDGMRVEPATEEQRKAFRCTDGEHLWYAEVWRKDKGHTFTAYGRSNFPGDTNFAVKTYPQEIARKRALYRALRDAFSMPLPNELSDGEWEQAEWQAPSVEIPMEQLGASFSEIRSETVDPSTGEIIDVEARVVGEAAPIGPRPDQIIAIHAMVRGIGWSEADYRGFLIDAHGVQSSKDLTEGQASGIIETLGALEGREQSRQRIEEIKDRLASKGMNLADLWGPIEVPDINYAEQRREQAAATVVEADYGEPASEPDLSEPFPLCSEEQWAEIQKYVSPKARASLNKEKLDFDTAEQIIEEWKPKSK